MNTQIKLGVNIDHVATIRQARMTNEPDPVAAASIAEHAGADGITIHLREDRRHIQDRDVEILRKTIHSRMNLEMGMSEEIIGIALKTNPAQVTLVPEKREEITTEGGLDVVSQLDFTTDVVKRFQDAGICVSLFIDPDNAQIEASAKTGAEFIEIHTGAYANTWPDENKLLAELAIIKEATEFAVSHNLRVNAGHGLTYHNVSCIASIANIEELNIGHSIISRSVLYGLESSVREMKNLMLDARKNC